MQHDNDDLSCKLHEATTALSMESNRRQLAEEDIVRLQESQRCLEKELLEQTNKLGLLQSILSSLSSALDLAIPVLQDIRQSTEVCIVTEVREQAA